MRIFQGSLFTLIPLLFAGAMLAENPAESVAAPSAQTVVLNDLEWAQATNGENIKWPDAVSYCADLALAGKSDWRLPALDELKALHDPNASDSGSIRSPFVIEDCCLWSGESLVDRAAEDGDEIAGQPEMYHWGFMFDGGLPYYAVHIFEDGQALCVRDSKPQTTG